MRILFLQIVAVIYCAGVLAQAETTSGFTPTERNYQFKLGSTIVLVKTFQYGPKKDNVFIHLHDDETTAVETAKMVLEEQGGLLIKIENNNERLISFELNKRKYKFDPNRIFTSAGVFATLKKFNRSFTNSSVRQVQKFGSFVLNKVPKNTSTVIAVHNNDEGRLSIYSYARGGDYEKDAAKVNVSGEHDPDNFFLTTDRSIYKKLSDKKYNIVLQNNKKAKDDGSLSIYYGRKNKSYVNVEAENGMIDEQNEMVRILLPISTYKPKP